MRLFVVLLITAAMLAGCLGKSNAPAQGEKEDVERAVEETPNGQKIQKEVYVPADVPAYTLTKDEEGMVQGFVVRSVAASTDVTGEESLEASSSWHYATSSSRRTSGRPSRRSSQNRLATHSRE